MIPARSAPVAVVVFFGMVLLMGATLGAHSVADGSDPINVTDRLESNMIHENGTLNTTDRSAQASAFERAADTRVTPDFLESPHADRWVRQQFAVPMIRITISVVGFGYAIGYALASTIGAAATRLLLNVGAVALLVGLVGRIILLFKRVAR